MIGPGGFQIQPSEFAKLVARLLVAKIFAPRVPPWLPTLAGEASDAAFFLLNFAGVEAFKVDQGIARSGGCFPYDADYPYSHSVLGMGVVGVAIAGARAV